MARVIQGRIMQPSQPVTLWVIGVYPVWMKLTPWPLSWT